MAPVLPTTAAIGDPQSQLETALIDEFLHARGTDRQRLRALPEPQVTRLMKAASAYASARLTELESRAHFVHEIQGVVRR